MFNFSAEGQVRYLSQYDIYSGLPSNRVYGVISDHFGYLWAATDKGIVRYNGYEFKTFGASEGLPSEDIWQLLEDNKGRIWLCTTSDEIGYLFAGKYHRVYSQELKGTIYPLNIKAIGESVLFFTTYVNGVKQTALCIEKNDTLHAFSLTEKMFGKDDLVQVSDTGISKESAEYILAHQIKPIPADDSCSYISYNNGLFQVIFQNNSIAVKKILTLNKSIFNSYYDDYRCFVSGRYFIYYNTISKTDSFNFISLETGVSAVVHLNDFGVKDRINYMYHGASRNSNSNVFVITGSYVLQFDPSDRFRFINKTVFTDIGSGLNGNDIFTFDQSSFWNTIIASHRNGLVIDYKVPNRFQRTSINLADYKHIGTVGDSLSFWWNEQNKTILSVDRHGVQKLLTDKSLLGINYLTEFSKDTLLLSGKESYFWIYPTRNIIKLDKEQFGYDVYSLIIFDRNEYFSISSSGFYDRKLDPFKAPKMLLDADKFLGLVYDSIRKQAWLHNLNKIRIHRKGGDSIILKDHFSQFGVRNIKQMCVDNAFGNIFFRGPNTVSCYNPETNRSQELFRNINLKDALICVSGRKIIAVGQFGVAYSIILGKMNLSDPILIPNIKNINYRYVYDFDVVADLVLMKTDKGLYSVSLQSSNDSLLKSIDPKFPNCFLTVKYADSMHSMRTGDTIILQQHEEKLQFDAINLYGNGIVKYSYRFSGDTAWRELNSNELNIPDRFMPGEFFNLTVKVHDDVWKSDEIMVRLYIKPYWYQTRSGGRLIWSAVAAAVLVLLMLSTFFTSRYVLRKAEKRNAQMELELKSIYAQLNPHFVFNTLNLALSLIKKERFDEAFSHITKFSRLLRSYLESSRRRTISLTSELANLRNYIDIQQTRFGSIFSYEIKVGQEIPSPENILIPSLLLQPIVENAIIHGLLPKDEKGHLAIIAEQGTDQNEIIIRVEDDGIGRIRSKAMNDANSGARESLGKNLIQDLVDIVNKYEKTKISISYIDKVEPLSGTIVEIKITDYRHGKV